MISIKLAALLNPAWYYKGTLIAQTPADKNQYLTNVLLCYSQNNIQAAIGLIDNYANTNGTLDALFFEEGSKDLKNKQIFYLLLYISS